MKLTKSEWLLRGAGRRMGLLTNLAVLVLMAIALLGMVLGEMSSAQAVSTTTVQGTVYLANGQAGTGTLSVSWPGFTTANGKAIAAGRTTVTIAPDGFVSVNLTPNLGATPAGLYYTVIYHMSDGTTSTEYWVVPSAAQAVLGAVRAQVMPAAQAVQAVSKAYVDQSISQLTQSLLTASGGTLSGPLYLNADPTQPLQAADKHYVDATFSKAVPLAGGNMTGALQTPAVNGVQAPAAGSAQTTLQAAITAAGTTGAVEIPPTYTGTDGFTNPNGVRVTDLRTSGAQQAERSVKEFGAVCDGTIDDTNALQSALNYAQAHGVALTIPQGVCKTRSLNWHGESIGGLGKQVSALMGFPGQDVLATVADSGSLLSNTRIHDLTIYVDQSMDVSCSATQGRAAAGSCAVNRPLESNSIFSKGGSGLTGTLGTGAAWAVGNCAIAMPAATGAGGNGLRVAEIENVEIVATGTDPMAGQYAGAHSTHTCGMYLAQWPQWSEFRNIDIRGMNTGIAIPALAGTTPAGLNADSNRWQNITIQATHGFTAASGSNNVLDNVVTLVANSAATAEPPTGLVLDFAGTQQGWTVRNAVVLPAWNAVQPQMTVTAAGGAVTGVAVGAEHGLGFDPYGAQVPLKFSGSCTAAATANVNSDGSIRTINVTQGGVGCSATTTASVNVAGTWDTAAAVNLIGGQNMTFFAGNLLKGNGGYTVWNATGSASYGTQLDGGGGILPGGGTYTALVANSRLGSAYPVDQFPGADFGEKLQTCLGAVSTVYGGTCDARNFTGTLQMSSSLTISTGNTTIQLPCATIATANQIVVMAGTRNVTLRGCALRGGSAASGSQGGTVFQYSGTGAMVQVGDPTYAVDTQGFHMDNAVVNTTAATSASAQGLVAFRTQEMDLESLYFLGNSNQTGITLDGTGNYTGGTFFDNALSGFQIAVNGIGHQVTNSATTDWLNASTFVRLHINCPTSGGSPISGTYGINLAAGDGNTFTGGDVEGCSTALHLGANAQNNTIVGLRNENSTSQVVAEAGSQYNNWMTGGTMFTGKLTDNGTRNSFLDTFHRSFNGMNGDWYGSQQDATVTNHYRIGIGAGNERGLLDRYQTDFGYRWTMGLSDATGGEQFYAILDELNSVNRLSIGQYNDGQGSTNNQTVINAAGTGAVVLNGSNNAGTGGVVIGSGGASETTVATINNVGNAQFNGTLQVGGTSSLIGTPTVKNQANAEIDAILWAGLTASQKEAFSYKDWNGNSQWYMVKDASNNWALNSATGGLDSFKAYQSTNSGDTYVNASNASGVVRVNYETGAGTAFKVYGGGSSSLYASFTGTTSIQFPGLAASSGHNCLQVDNSGYVTNTGSACGSGSGGGSGTVNSGNTGQIAYYTGNGTTVGGVSAVPVTTGGTGATTAAGALASLGGAPLAGAAFTGTVRSPNLSGLHYVDGVNSWGATTTITAAYTDACTSGGTVEISQYYAGAETIPAGCALLGISSPVQSFPRVVDDRKTQTASIGRLNVLQFGMDETGTRDTSSELINGVISASLSPYSTTSPLCHPAYLPTGRYQIHEALIPATYNSCILLEGPDHQHGAEVFYGGAGGSGSYLVGFPGLSFGGIKDLTFFGVNPGSTVSTMAQNAVTVTQAGASEIDSGSVFSDFQIADFYGDAITVGQQASAGQITNGYFHNFRTDSLGGYFLRAWLTDTANGDPIHLYDYTEDNYISGSAAAYGISQGFIPGTGSTASSNGAGELFCSKCGGMSIHAEDARDEENLPTTNVGNGDQGRFFFNDDSANSTPAIVAQNISVAGNPNAPHPFVSTATGHVKAMLIGNNSFQNVSSIYKNRSTQQEYGDDMQAMATFWSFGRNAQGVQGYCMEGQCFDVIPRSTLTANYSPRQIGDWFFEHQTDFIPGTMGPYSVVVSPLSGRASLQPAQSITTAGTLSANANGGANLTGFNVAYVSSSSSLHLGDNLTILNAGSGGSGSTNVTVSCVNMTATTNSCIGLTGQGVVVTPAPACLTSGPCPSLGTVSVNWAQLSLSNFGLEANRTTSTTLAGTSCPYTGDYIWVDTPAAGSTMGYSCSSALLWVAMPSYPIGSALSAVQVNGTPVTPASGAVNLVAGPGITLTPSGNAVTIAGAGSSVASFLGGLVENCMMGSSSAFTCLGDYLTQVPGASATGFNNSLSVAPMMSSSASAAASGSGAGWFGSSIYYDGRQPKLTFGVAYNLTTDYSSNARIWLGLTGCNYAMMMASDTPSCSYAAIRYSTAAGDTTYKCVTDNGSGVPTITPIGISPSSFTTQVALEPMSINIGPGSVTCSVNGAAATNTTTLPASTATFADIFVNTTLTTTATHLRLNGVNGVSQNGAF